jgi:amylosucrase
MKNRSKIELLYKNIYQDHPQFDRSLLGLFNLMDNAKKARKPELLKMDQTDSEWYFSHEMIGMTLYVDLFAGSFVGLINKINYFKELGITYLHLMPLLKPREGENDGGYAVADYRDVDPNLGSLKEFKELLHVYNSHDIKICIDYVVNHVAKEQEWAKKALEGNKEFQEMFIMFDDEIIPNQYNETVPEVLPNKCPGNFTYYPTIKKYVFTSFSEFQLDLNFKNPAVFNGMIDNMLYLANLGVSMIRLDAIPFMWKELGTTSRNLQPIHDLMQMFYLIKDEVCPSCALLGEAIVEPHKIVSYFGSDEAPECEVMYNANLMVDVYNSFATRDVRLMQQDANRFELPKKGTWMNYVRCHDDIGWGFNEEAIIEMGFDPFSHKQFLINFYSDNFYSTFSKGELYQFNPINHDARINGTLASLLGLQKAIETNEEFKQLESIRRINLAHALILSYRGIPLIYSGDEIATLNDQSYKEDPEKAQEGRWVHRPFFDWDRAKDRDESGTAEHDVFQMLKKLIAVRKELPFLHGQSKQLAIDLQNQSVFGFVREYKQEKFLALFNFSESNQQINTYHLREALSGKEYIDLVQGRSIDLSHEKIELSPYEFIWSVPKF